MRPNNELYRKMQSIDNSEHPWEAASDLLQQCINGLWSERSLTSLRENYRAIYRNADEASDHRLAAIYWDDLLSFILGDE